MPRGLSVFLTGGGGGMEYFGGTISSPAALSHEVFHMYFACSAVARTYRDSWFDEAITSWYDQTYPDYLVPIADGYRSNMVSGRSPVAVGFDVRAYYQGTQIIETMARLLGGRSAMAAFLGDRPSPARFRAVRHHGPGRVFPALLGDRPEPGVPATGFTRGREMPRPRSPRPAASSPRPT